MKAVTIGDCAGWLHEAAGGRGVILCGGLGYEDLCSRRTLALMADGIAEAGLPALRFDWTGTGDSAGDLNRPDILSRWGADLRAAVSFMREKVGVSEVALVGLRAGASIVIEQAPVVGAERIVLMAPVVNGRTYLRELSAFAGGAEDSATTSENDLLVAGYHFPAELVGALRSIDLRRPEQRPAEKIFVMAQRRDHASDMFEANLESLGASVWTSFFVGYDRLMSDCLTSRVAGEAIDAVIDWVSQEAPAGDSRSVDARSGQLLGEAWREKRVLIEDMAGVLTMPRGTVTGRALVVLNAGATPHQGAGGQIVAHARRLAAEGVATLRLDLPGIGDSPSSRSGRPNLYSPDMRQGLGAVLDWLETHNLRDVTLLGVSSGAYQAFEAALEHPRIHRAVLVNPLCFQWSATEALQVETWHRRRANEVTNRLREVEHIPAPADIGALAALALPLAHRFARSSVDALRTLAALGGGSNPVQRRFSELSERGVGIVLVHGETDPSREELARWMGPDGVMALSLPGVSRHVVAGADHLMTTATAQSAMRDILLSTFGASVVAEGDAAKVAAA